MVIRRRRSTHELRTGPPSARYFDAVAKKLPILDWAPLYSQAKFQSDVIAGLTVGLMVVPQSLAYATNIAELPARYGLYSSYVGVIVYMFFGTSKDVTLGPTAIMSKIVSEATGSGKLAKEMMCSTGKNGVFPNGIGSCGTNQCCDSVAKATKLCIIAGIINMLMGFLNLGFLVDFISLPVLYGFTTSASLTIAAGQVHSLIGISGSHSAYKTPSGEPITSIPFSKFMNIFKDTFESLPKTGDLGGWKWPDIILAIICISTTLLLQRVKKKMDQKKKLSLMGRFVWFLGAAGNFFTVALGTIIAYAWNEIAKDDICSKGHKHDSHTVGVIEKNCLTLTGHIDAGLPDAIAPSISGGDIGSLMSGAILVALIGYLESIAIAKAFARSNGYEVASSQELVAIGASNIVSGFFQSYPVTGSFSRTAVNSASSVATPLSGVVTGTVVMCALAFMTKIMAFIPKASLGAIVIVSVLKMFNYEIVLKMWKVNRIELIPWAISFFGCTFTDIEYGVGFGAFANIVIVLYYTARPAFIVESSSKTRVIKIGGSVLYPAGSSWKDFVREQLDDATVKSIVLDFAMVHRLDYTGLQSLTEITEDCRKERVVFDVANVNLLVEQMLDAAHYFEKNDLDRSSCNQSTAAAVASVEQSLVVNPGGSRATSADDTTPLLSVNN